jgi:hypothetical protein
MKYAALVVGVVHLGAAAADASAARRKISAWCEVNIQLLFTKE